MCVCVCVGLALSSFRLFDLLIRRRLFLDGLRDKALGAAVRVAFLIRIGVLALDVVALEQCRAVTRRFRTALIIHGLKKAKKKSQVLPGGGRYMHSADSYIVHVLFTLRHTFRSET